jgi:hypothetical protein
MTRIFHATVIALSELVFTTMSTQDVSRGLGVAVAMSLLPVVWLILNFDPFAPERYERRVVAALDFSGGR